jgi:hypothetical protein
MQLELVVLDAMNKTPDEVGVGLGGGGLVSIGKPHEVGCKSTYAMVGRHWRLALLLLLLWERIHAIRTCVSCQVDLAVSGVPGFWFQG